MKVYKINYHCLCFIISLWPQHFLYHSCIRDIAGGAPFLVWDIWSDRCGICYIWAGPRPIFEISGSSRWHIRLLSQHPDVITLENSSVQPQHFLYHSCIRDIAGGAPFLVWDIWSDRCGICYIWAGPRPIFEISGSSRWHIRLLCQHPDVITLENSSVQTILVP